jgi:hypothetical protein
MLYMAIENFRGGDPVPVYRRFRDRAPDAGRHRVSRQLGHRRSAAMLQRMECDDRRLLDECIANCSDITEFEVIPVIMSAEAAARISPRL